MSGTTRSFPRGSPVVDGFEMGGFKASEIKTVECGRGDYDSVEEVESSVLSDELDAELSEAD